MTTLQTPRDFKGEWEVGLVEMDLETVQKPSTDIVPYDFNCFQFELNDETKEYEKWKRSELFPKRFRVELPSGIEGIAQLQKVLYEKHPFSKYFLSFTIGRKYIRMDMTTMVDNKRENVSHVMIPDTSCETWSTLFDYDFTQLERPDKHVDFEKAYLDKQYAKRNADYIYSPTEDIPTTSKLPVSESKTSARSHGPVCIKGHNYNWILSQIYDSAQDSPSTYLGGQISDPYTRSVMLHRHTYDIKDAPDWFYVYCDIVEPVRVADTSAQILRSIPFNSYKHVESNNYTFSPIFYKRLNTERVTSIRIMLVDSIGNFVKFNNRVRLVLHFRKIKEDGGVQ